MKKQTKYTDISTVICNQIRWNESDVSGYNCIHGTESDHLRNGRTVLKSRIGIQRKSHICRIQVEGRINVVSKVYSEKSVARCTGAALANPITRARRQLMHMHMQSSWIPRPFFNSTLLSSCGNAFFFSRRCVKKRDMGSTGASKYRCRNCAALLSLRFLFFFPYSLSSPKL